MNLRYIILAILIAGVSYAINHEAVQNTPALQETVNAPQS